MWFLQHMLNWWCFLKLQWVELSGPPYSSGGCYMFEHWQKEYKWFSPTSLQPGLSNSSMLLAWRGWPAFTGISTTLSPPTTLNQVWDVHTAAGVSTVFFFFVCFYKLPSFQTDLNRKKMCIHARGIVSGLQASTYFSKGAMCSSRVAVLTSNRFVQTGVSGLKCSIQRHGDYTVPYCVIAYTIHATQSNISYNSL